MADGIGAEIERGAAGLGLEVTSVAAQRLERYAKLLLEWNERMNLTAITEPVEVAVKHFVDSLSLLWVLDEGVESVADVGTGAGFPGLVVAIARPDLRVTLIDALGKRLTFLGAVIDALGIGNATLLHARAEEAGRRADLREGFDVVTARAVAHLATLAEYCLPLARVGGEFVAMKARAVDEEVAIAGPAIATLGGEVTTVLRFALPGGREERVLVRVSKLRPTPEAYPRRAGVPERRPIGGGTGATPWLRSED